MGILALTLVLKKDYVTIQHSLENKFIRIEWKGVIPSGKLREGLVYACKYVQKNSIEYMLADYSRMMAPTMDDQVWISNHFSELLQRSKLRKVANLMAQDLFQQIAIDKIYELATEVPIPCESMDFTSEDEALDWLFTKD